MPDGSVSEQAPKASAFKLDCASGFGSATFVTGTAGFFAAGVVVSALAHAEDQTEDQEDA